MGVWRQIVPFLLLSLSASPIHPSSLCHSSNQQKTAAGRWSKNQLRLCRSTHKSTVLACNLINTPYRWPQSMQIIHVVVTLWSTSFHSHLYYRWTFNIHIVSAALLMWTFGCQEMNRTWTECVAILNKSPTMPTNHSIFTWHWIHRPFRSE